MRIINPKVEIIPQGSGLEGIYKQIEIAGRTCYKSEDKITEGSAKEFVNRMIKSGHGAMLEHGTIYLCIPYDSKANGVKYLDNKYSEHYVDNDNNEYITTNFRVLVENNWLDDLKYLCEPTEYHAKRVTAKFTTQIAVTREINRHRVDSMAEQSTRYCNYSKDKFKGNIIINKPTWISDDVSILEGSLLIGDLYKICYCSNEDNPIMYWLFANMVCEFSYMKLIELGWTPEKARTILPLDTNSELVHTAFVDDWKHFFDLRCANSAHPDIQVLANNLKQQFINNKLL